MQNQHHVNVIPNIWLGSCCQVPGNQEGGNKRRRWTREAWAGKQALPPPPPPLNGGFSASQNPLVLFLSEFSFPEFSCCSCSRIP